MASVKVCIKLDLLVLKWGSVTGDASVHSWHPHLCMLVGRLSQDGSSTWSPPPPPRPLSPLFCQQLSVSSCFSSFFLHDRTSYDTPSPSPSSSSTCLLFFSSGGERANKQSNKWHFPVHMCGYLFQGVNNYILTRSPRSLPSLNTCVMCLFLTVFGGSRCLWPTHWCLSDKTAVTKDLAAE